MEEFWQYYNHIPKPGKVFFDGESKASVGPSNKVIDELSIFKKGIKPEWEDAANRTGAEWFCRKTFPMPQLVSAPCCGTHVLWRRHPCRQGS